MRRNRKNRKWIWLIVIVAIIAIIIVSCSVIQQRAQQALYRASIKTATAKTGTITKTVSGTGTLQSRDVKEIQAFSGVLIDEVLVKVGDEVGEGAILATLDVKTLAEMAANMSASLDKLDAELWRMSGKKAKETLYAPVEGRVKAIFAQAGDNAGDIVTAHGALMVLSADGKLRADFTSTTALTVGDDVFVRAGEATYTAKVIKVAQGSYAATLTDDGPEVGVEAVVLAGDGATELGKGIIRVNSPVTITAPGGTVDKVHVKLNAKVDRGDKLLTLKNVPLSSDYLKKLAEREEAAADYAEMLALVKNPVITSPISGVVKQIVAEEGKYLTAKDATSVKTAAFTLNSYEMELNVLLDELDIPLISTGLTASVSFDALPDTEFEATVARVSKLGTVSGGNTKYSVILSLAETEGLVGMMNATATINVETKENIVTLPLNALNEENGVNYVYLDSGIEGVLGERRDVRTGISDGIMVEITEGLKDGDIVMYRVATDDFDFQSMAEQWRRQMTGRR